jgi:hypothetical protein
MRGELAEVSRLWEIAARRPSSVGGRSRRQLPPWGKPRKGACARNFRTRAFFLFLPFGENHLIDEEEDHHGHAAVQNRRADVIDEVRHKQSGYGNPYAVDGVDDAGDDAVAGLLVPDFIYNIGTTVLNGGISMVIFFFVNKIIFPEGEKAAK